MCKFRSNVARLCGLNAAIIAEYLWQLYLNEACGDSEMYRHDMPTRASVIRDAIDYALSVSVNFEEFKAELKNMGYAYQFNPKRKYWTVTLISKIKILGNSLNHSK